MPAEASAAPGALSPRRRLFLARALLVLLSSVLALSALEIALRVRSPMPLEDLESVTRNYSELTHHNRDGYADDQAEVTRHGDCRGAPPIRALTLGDSWMERGVLPQALCEGLAARLERCVTCINGGTSSYGPSVALLKGRALSSRERPHVVFLHVDDTDMGDEWWRYRQAARRDPASGKLLSVSYRDDVPTLIWLRGIQEAGRSRSYLLRFVRKLLHTRLFMPRVTRLSDVGSFAWERWMMVAQSPEPRREHPAAMAHFETVVGEAARELGELTGAPGRVVLLHHPHELAVEGRYNQVVGEIVRDVAAKTGARAADVGIQVEAVHGAAWRDELLWPADPASHLSETGYKSYARFVLEQVGEGLVAELKVPSG